MPPKKREAGTDGAKKPKAKRQKKKKDEFDESESESDNEQHNGNGASAIVEDTEPPIDIVTNHVFHLKLSRCLQCY